MVGGSGGAIVLLGVVVVVVVVGCRIPSLGFWMSELFYLPCCLVFESGVGLIIVGLVCWAADCTANCRVMIVTRISVVFETFTYLIYSSSLRTKIAEKGHDGHLQPDPGKVRTKGHICAIRTESVSLSFDLAHSWD